MSKLMGLLKHLLRATIRLCPLIVVLCCPALVYAHGGHAHGGYAHDGHAHDGHAHGSHAHGGHAHGSWETLKHFAGPFESTLQLWMYAIVSTILISAAPFLILCFIPLENASQHSSLLKVLLSFASGGLLGDAFLHLIPHAVSPHSHHEHHDHSHHHTHEEHHHHEHHDHVNGHTHHDHHGNHMHSHDHMQDMVVGLWVLAGIVAFLIVEKFVRLAKAGHAHSHGRPIQQTVKEEDKEVKGGSSDGSNLRRRKVDSDGKKESSGTASPSTTPHQQHAEIKVSGYLNLAADFTHNFTDGLAIGASYLAGRSVGIITTLTILLHEVPHEIGDFAILIQSGYPKRKAMYLQLLTAVGAIAGTVCGLLAEGVGTAATAWILPFTAGGFIYIATVSVIPELLEDTAPGQSIKEVLALFLGIAMMVLITCIE